MYQMTFMTNDMPTLPTTRRFTVLDNDVYMNNWSILEEVESGNTDNLPDNVWQAVRGRWFSLYHFDGLFVHQYICSQGAAQYLLWKPENERLVLISESFERVARHYMAAAISKGGR